MNTPKRLVRQIFERSRFAILLASLVGLFILQPMLPSYSNGEERIGADTAMAAVLLASFWSLGHPRWARLVVLVLVAGAIATAWLARAAPGSEMNLVSTLAALAALSFTTGMMLWHLVRERDVRADTILGGICVYLLIGGVWALIYSFLERLQPGSLSLASGAPIGASLGETLVLPGLLDYSVSVLTTIGPQQIHPVSRAALTWTGVEAMAGQLFLVIFISRLVGRHGAVGQK